MLVLLLFGFVKIIPCNETTLQRRPITMKIDPEVHLYMVEVGEKEWFESDEYILRYSQFPAAMLSTCRSLHQFTTSSRNCFKIVQAKGE
jgi:hypothetical protein